MKQKSLKITLIICAVLAAVLLLAIVLISYSGLTVLFDRLSLLSCALRLAGCAAFVLLARLTYEKGAPKGEREPRRKASGGFSRREWMKIACALALMLLAAISWPVMQEIHSALTKAPEVLR